MLLTVSKRLEFSASRRLFSPDLSIEQNRARFGEESAAKYGSGRNYVAYFVFSGEPDPVTGMLINISEIKRRAGEVINDRYDHRFLNDDNPAFRDVVPTAENIALQLLRDATPLFSGERAKLAAVHLRESPNRSATAFAKGPVDANYWFEFSAARRTVSPHLSDAENEKLYGPSVRDHGHSYRVRLTFDGNSLRDDVVDLVQRLRAALDHKHLNHDVPALREQPVTTESIARLMLRETAERSTALRVRLHERDDFFVEAWRDGEMFVGMRESFGAAHRLHVPQFSDAQNAELFGKCNNPGGHGHFYTSEATIAANYDERTGAAFDYAQMRSAIGESIDPWRDKHLDRETEEFRNISSTGENIVRALWDKIDNRMRQRLVRLRLWETANNRFTLRKL
ncbi:MAG: 6-pyruvoyltetrahydropterin/6-carboxytetrahydropterin synthase [Verrucomicrobiota bacterium]|jgi:6-pyruvoyltetrahydropterin/6-carboxytetrahydropterin synthase